MSVAGFPSSATPSAPTRWILMGVGRPTEFPSTFHSTYRAPPGPWNPDASIAPPCARSQMSGAGCGWKGPAGCVAVATPMQ